MNDDEFAEHLRDRIDRAAPHLHFEAPAVISRARRRRRAQLVSSGALALVVAITGTAWFSAEAPHFAGDSAVVREGASSTSSASPAASPVPAAPSAATAIPSATPESTAGTVNTPYWHVSRIDYLWDLQGKYQADESGYREEWIGNKRNGVLIKNRDSAHPEIVLPGDTDWGQLSDGAAGTEDITWDVLGALPTNAHDLRSLLVARWQKESGFTANEQIVLWAIGFLAGSPASPALRDAAWQIITSTPGIDLTSGITDTRGRTGTRVVISARTNEKLVAIIDPHAKRDLQTEMQINGKAHSRSVYLNEGPASSLPTR